MCGAGPAGGECNNHGHEQGHDRAEHATQNPPLPRAHPAPGSQRLRMPER